MNTKGQQSIARLKTETCEFVRAGSIKTPWPVSAAEKQID
jgi:hypothetical protein